MSTRVMKKIIAITKREDFDRVLPLLEDRTYFTKKEKNLVRFMSTFLMTSSMIS